MKKIIMSLAMIVAVGAVVVGATGAFFSDTEKSEGNTFTAGSIDLLVDSEAHYDGMICKYIKDGELDGYYWVADGQGDPANEALLGEECTGSWTETDLGPTHAFFNYSDLKPGDWGENTISLHVENNDAYVCAIIDNMDDDDMGLTEPEEEAGDTTGGDGEGELSDEIHFFAWADDGDNLWESGEDMLFSNVEGPASDVIDGVVYPLYTPSNAPLAGALAGDSTVYIGLYWCYGDLTVTENTNTLECDGSAVTNMTQTDSMSADISFYVEQARNNENFTCPELVEKVFVRTANSGQNETNKGLNRPHIDYAIDGDCIDFDFVNPTSFLFVFDYRVDSEAGEDHQYTDLVIGGGELSGQTFGQKYNQVTTTAGTTESVRVCGDNQILAGLREGAEQDWYLEWIQFDAQ